MDRKINVTVPLTEAEYHKLKAAIAEVSAKTERKVKTTDFIRTALAAQGVAIEHKVV